MPEDNPKTHPGEKQTTDHELSVPPTVILPLRRPPLTYVPDPYLLENKSKTPGNPPPAPEITPASLLNSLQAFDAIVQKVVEINAGRWIFPEDAPIIVRAVLKAIAEVNNERNERQDQ